MRSAAKTIAAMTPTPPESTMSQSPPETCPEGLLVPADEQVRPFLPRCHISVFHIGHPEQEPHERMPSGQGFRGRRVRRVFPNGGIISAHILEGSLGGDVPGLRFKLVDLLGGGADRGVTVGVRATETVDSGVQEIVGISHRTSPSADSYPAVPSVCVPRQAIHRNGRLCR